MPFRFRCVFIEQEAAYVESLARVVGEADVPRDLVAAKVVQGDFLTELPTVLASIPRWEPVLVFVDPFGYRHVRIDTVLAILANGRRHEVFLTFMGQFIGRWLSDPTKASTFDEVLGTRSWRDFVGRPNVEARVTKLYAEMLETRLREGGAPEAFAFPILVRLQQGASPYSLIHISQHRKARLEMENAVREAQPLTQAPLLLARPGLVDAADAVVRHADGRISAMDVAAGVWERERAAFWDPDIRQALQELHVAGEIEIHMRSGKPRRVGTAPVATDLIVHTGRGMEGVADTLF